MLQGKSLGRLDQRVPADFRVNQINFFKNKPLSYSGSISISRFSNIYSST